MRPDVNILPIPSRFVKRRMACPIVLSVPCSGEELPKAMRQIQWAILNLHFREYHEPPPLAVNAQAEIMRGEDGQIARIVKFKNHFRIDVECQ